MVEGIEGITGPLIGENDDTPPAVASPPAAASPPPEKAGGTDPATSTTPASPVPQPDPYAADKVAAYEFLMNDPEMREFVQLRMKQRMGEAPTPQPLGSATAPIVQPGQGDAVSREEYNALADQLRGVVGRMATTEIESFRAATPGFTGELETQTGQLMRDYGLPLEKAYPLAQVLKNGGVLPAGQRTATALPAEAGPGGGGQRTTGPVDPMAAVHEKIKALPQNKQRFESALDLVIRGAIDQEAARQR